LTGLKDDGNGGARRQIAGLAGGWACGSLVGTALIRMPQAITVDAGVLLANTYGQMRPDNV